MNIKILYPHSLIILLFFSLNSLCVILNTDPLKNVQQEPSENASMSDAQPQTEITIVTEEGKQLFEFLKTVIGNHTLSNDHHDSLGIGKKLSFCPSVRHASIWGNEYNNSIKVAVALHMVHKSISMKSINPSTQTYWEKNIRNTMDALIKKTYPVWKICFITIEGVPQNCQISTDMNITPTTIASVTIERKVWESFNAAVYELHITFPKKVADELNIKITE